MKKSLALSLALAFSVAAAGTAFAAANPFADVPSKHWSYEAVSQLAKDGIVDGYSDKTFQGDKTMTRYEMAQVVGKAVARADKASAADKKLIDKLSTEFAGELNNLGVRVAKLEANQSNLKLSGNLRVRWNNTEDKANGQQWKDRFFLDMNSQINENTSMYARYVFADDKFNQDTAQRLSDLAMTTKFGDNSVTLGRYSLNLGPTGYFAATTGGIDGIMTNSKIGNANVMLGYAQVRNTDNSLVTNNLYIKNIAFAEGSYTTGKAKFYADYFKNLNDGQSDGNSHTVLDAYKVLGGAAVYNFDKNVKLTGEYYKNSAEDVKMADGSEPTAAIVRVNYKGAVASKPHSWGGYIEHAQLKGNAMPYVMEGPMHIVNPADFGIADTINDGIKFYAAEFDYTLAKNITFNAMHVFNAKSTATGDDARYKTFSRAQITYFF